MHSRLWISLEGNILICGINKKGLKKFLWAACLKTTLSYIGGLFKIILFSKKQQLELETVWLLTSKTNFLIETSWQYLYYMKDPNPNIGQKILKRSGNMLECDPCLVSLNYLNFSTFYLQEKMWNVPLWLCLAVTCFWELASPLTLMCNLPSLAAPCNDKMYAWKCCKLENTDFLSNHSFLPDTASVFM